MKYIIVLIATFVLVGCDGNSSSKETKGSFELPTGFYMERIHGQLYVVQISKETLGLGDILTQEATKIPVNGDENASWFYDSQTDTIYTFGKNGMRYAKLGAKSENDGGKGSIAAEPLMGENAGTIFRSNEE